MPKKIDLKDGRFGRLLVIEEAEKENGRTTWLCKCECGNHVKVKTVYLITEQTRSCGCLKKTQDAENLRNQYDNKRIDGVVTPLFKGKEPRKDSSTGYRGVSKYYTRKSKELRYRAWITVNGKRYYKSGFKTAEEAYYQGRLALENEHLPKIERRKKMEMIQVKNDWDWIVAHCDNELNDELIEMIRDYTGKMFMDRNDFLIVYGEYGDSMDGAGVPEDGGEYLSFGQWLYEVKQQKDDYEV